MKTAILVIFIISSSFALELSIDTLSTGEIEVLYINSGSDTVRFDSARVDLIKSENNQYHLGLVSYFTDNATGNPARNSEGFHFFNYGEFYMGDNNVNNFQLQLRPGEIISLELEGFDYQVFGIIPENGPAPLVPPQPMQAKMVFFTNKGIDSIIINGMQTNQPRSDAVVNRTMHVRRPKTGLTEYYTINGKRVKFTSRKKTILPNGIGITVEKHPDGKILYGKRLSTR